MTRLSGSLHAWLLYDVAEEIRLEPARELLGAHRPAGRSDFRGRLPEYARFARPPVVHALGGIDLGGESWSATIHLYDYGVVSVALELPFVCDWDELVRLCSRWIASADLERAAAAIAREHTERIATALMKPYPTQTFEDYYAVHVREAIGDDGRQLQAGEVIARHGGRIAQIVRAESAQLSEFETSEILREWVSYYPTDLLVVAWMAAFIYDTPEGATPLLELLEYASTKLIEFRY